MLKISHNQSAIAQQKLVRQLRRSDTRKAKRLAEVLEACCASAPCRSAACPSCGAAFQQAAVQLIDEVIREPARAIRSRMSAITVVPATGIVAPDELSVDAFERVGAEVLAAFADLQLPPAIIGLEATFNEDFTERTPPHWCVHPHIIELDWLSPKQDQGLRAAFPASPFVNRCEPPRVSRRPFGLGHAAKACTLVWA